ncbi:PQ-loop repeat-containing protein 3 isoform X2 [Cyanistes caeruleus]|uniref:PQ-loop repeat-containing protein 3 isoform X2 n=1 Tax=Cyanistes caeruleus TaxID=156563 RepID=UPI000CDADFD2|nr:PQ-loop repeat-containing protein 3 isoform X2 [Cyanistes caeruleus]
MSQAYSSCRGCAPVFRLFSGPCALWGRSCTRQTGFPHRNHHIVFLRYQIYYGYPLKTYLEYPIIIAQDVILIYCIMHFSGNAKRALVYALIYWGGWYMLTLEKWIIDLAMNVCTFISAASKLVQLQHLWQTKDSGQVSTLTWGMSVYTSSEFINSHLWSSCGLHELFYSCLSEVPFSSSQNLKYS